MVVDGGMAAAVAAAFINGEQIYVWMYLDYIIMVKTLWFPLITILQYHYVDRLRQPQLNGRSKPS